MIEIIKGIAALLTVVFVSGLALISTNGADEATTKKIVLSLLAFYICVIILCFIF
jgi:hypothetical protein